MLLLYQCIGVRARGVAAMWNAHNHISWVDFTFNVQISHKTILFS